MTASAVGYEQVRAWVAVMLGQTHATVVRTTAWIVLCVLTAQRITAAALARALPADQAGSGRARLTRVRRWWTGPPLEQTVVSPQLIQAGLTLLPLGQPVVVALDTTRLGPWEVGRLVVGQRTAATIGCGRRDQPLVPGWIALSVAVVVPPKHKQNPGTERERRKRAIAHAKQRARKYGRHTTPPSATAQRYAQTWVLFTTAPTVAHAVAEYAQRLAIEETFRDWHSGWGVRTVVVALRTETRVDRLIGVVCLTYSLQMSLGQ